MHLHPITKLQREHSNMWRVQQVMHLQLERLWRGEPTDSALLANAFYYMRKFPSTVHHPKEDLIYEKLLEAGTPLAKEVSHILSQHEELYEIEDELIDLVLQLPKCRERVLQLGRRYLTIQTEHMEIEERLLFPQARKLLTASDWREVRALAGEVEDPLFGRRIAARFQSLYDYLLREAANDGLTVPGTGPRAANAAAAKTVAASRRARVTRHA